MKKRILGLDTGSNSLGWAIVDHEDDGHYTLIDKGVLVFQEGVKIDKVKRIESSKASERTGHRALRRQYFRRRLRKIEVLKALIKHQLCPALSEEDLKMWKLRKTYPLRDDFMMWQRTNEAEDVNPYHSRFICLTETLNLQKEQDRFTLGRALYHLAQRRGFKSNRLDANEEKESGTVKTGIAKLSQEMKEAGCKYLGEYFYKLYREKGNLERLRTRYTDREQHYKAEFKAICEKQHLSEEMVHDLERAIFFQRPLRSQRQSVGKCTFEKDKTRCCDSHPLYEEFRMLSFLNNVRLKGPYDDELRPLKEEELKKIDSLFYRVSKPNFDFEEIAKKLAGKGMYQHVSEPGDRPYKFNYRMSQGVPGCPTIAQFKQVFGEDWQHAIAETFDLNQHKDGTLKTVEEMVSDVWNVLHFFDSKEKLKEYGIHHLQLSEEQAEKFSKIRLSQNYASLSLKAIRHILPFLRMGMLYSHAVFMGKLPDLLGEEIWNDDAQRDDIIRRIRKMAEVPTDKEREQRPTLEFCIKSLLSNEFGVSEEQLDTLYHPSMIETYPDARPNQDGVRLLGSPCTNAVRNPMAMRSLHKVRKLVNALIKEGKITPDTEVHVEYARSLNNANMRAAINDRQRELEKKHKQFAEEIKKLYKAETGKEIEPTETEILKYQLWTEQGHICLYTGKQIGIADFIGASPAFDIEHTIPRSAGGDSTQENMTLCDGHFNRFIKKASLPSQLANFEDILTRLEPWKEKMEDLTKQVDKISTRGIWDKTQKDNLIRKKNRLKMELSYWRGKYERFTMKEVPEGFALRQGAGIGLISKYAALYLKSYFHNPLRPELRQVYSIKGPVTAEFRKMWGIQDEYEKKSRDNHTHHCIDAIVIACIGKNEINQMGKFHHDMFDYRESRREKPIFPKPWETFTQDLKQISEELIVVHDTTDHMPKKASRVMLTPHGKKQAKGDCARGCLHKDTYYGAIQQNGEVNYVVRRTLDANFSLKDVEKIVDEVVREKVRAAFVEGKLVLPVFMNQEKQIEIKKVRCLTPSVKSPLHIRHHRDVSLKDYKQQFHVANDGNYCMGIYEGTVKGKVKRDYKLVSNIEAGQFFNDKRANHDDSTIVPVTSPKGFALKHLLKVGQMVLLYENTPDEIDFHNVKDLAKRLYKIVGLNHLPSGTWYGRIQLLYFNEARDSKEYTTKNGMYRVSEVLRPSILLLHTQFNALVEGEDFEITTLGEIKRKERPC